jgi:excisionase family DNA binding protein
MAQPAPISPSLPTADEQHSAQQAALLLAQQVQPLRLTLSDGQHLTLPPIAATLLQAILAQLALGKTVALLPLDAEVSTFEAAELLHVSRPFVIKLLAQGAMPYRRVGSHRRLRLSDVLAYQQQLEAQSQAAFAALAQQAQELQLGY